MRGSSIVVPVLLAGGLAVSIAGAAGETTLSRRFDDLLRRDPGTVVAVAPRDVDDLDSADGLRAGWEAFRRRHGGRWRVHLDERTGLPTLVSGPGIEIFSSDEAPRVSLEQLEARVRNVLRGNADVLGGVTPHAELDTDASGSIGRDRWQLVFRQVVDGVPVENSRMDVQIVRGRLTLFGTTHWGAPTTDGVPRITAADARDFLDAYLSGALADLEAVAEPELVLLARDADPAAGQPRKWTGARGAGLRHELLWRLRYRDPATPGEWIAEVDAHDGTVRAFYDGTHYVAVRGGVYPEAPDVGCTSGGCEIAGFPMPFADWTEDGQGTAFADGQGTLECSDPAATFETRLEGPYARVEDTCGPLLESASCDGVLDLGLKAGENCEVAPGASAGNTAAARSAYYHVNRVNEVARFYNPDNTWLQGPVTIHSNWDSVCNASYGGGGIYVYRSGTSWAGCANSGEIQGIVVHEWGHGYDENDGGGWDNTSEAYGDIVSMLASRQSCFGPGLFTDGSVCSGYGDTCLTCTGFRDHDWAARQANTPATPQDFVQNYCSPGEGPCGRGVHCETYPIGEAVYDLATRDLPAAGMDPASAWQLVERLWYSTRAGSGGDIYTCALPDSDSCAASSWYQRMRVADDDDGDLSNGTPHAAALWAAFARHNIACGAPDAPENQSTSSCPALAAPVLTLEETGEIPGLQWSPVTGASQFLVFRGDLGCDRQQAVVAELPGATTAYADTAVGADLSRYYRVQAVGANEVCRSPVSNCAVSATGPRLQMNGHRLIEDGINDDADGRLEPGETVALPVTLFNGGSGDASAVSGRLRTVDPGQGRVIDPLVAYPDLAVGEAAESPDPHFALTLFETGVACGDTVTLELEMDAAESATRSDTIAFALGRWERDFVKVDDLLIPRLTPSPVVSTLEITAERSIAELDVSVAIAHPNVAELIVELTSPEGTTVRLHDRSGGGSGLYTRYDLDAEPDGPGTMADFAGESIAGTWSLSVQDTVFGYAGQANLQGFTLYVTPTAPFDCDTLTCAEPLPDAPDGLLVDRTIPGGDGQVDLQFSWSGVVGVAGYHLLHSPGATFDGQVDLTGRTSGETTLTLPHAVAQLPQIAFFQVRGVNACNQESP